MIGEMLIGVGASPACFDRSQGCRFNPAATMPLGHRGRGCHTL